MRSRVFGQCASKSSDNKGKASRNRRWSKQRQSSIAKSRPFRAFKEASSRFNFLPPHIRITYDGARGITERNVRIEAVLLERTMTLLNCHDLDIDDKRQFRMHRIQRAEVLAGIH